MRKSTKIILGIAGSLIVVGGICWILVLALIHGDWQRLSVYDPDESTQRQTYSIPAEQVHSLQIQAVDHTVRILVADTDQVQISYMEQQDETYSIDLDDQGNLTIHYQQDRHWIQNLSLIHISALYTVNLGLGQKAAIEEIFKIWLPGPI